MTAPAALPVVAIVGRPNVGKSALFNRVSRRRTAIVEDIPGVTRDRLYETVEWGRRRFSLVDTGGFRSGEAEGLAAQVRAQVTAALAEASLVLFVVDARDGLVPEDRAIADLLRRSRTPVLLVANKVDSAAHEPAAQEFYALGLGDPLPVSAHHGRGVGDLLDAVVALLPDAARPHDVVGPVSEAPESPAGEVTVAVVGRPNVGKSSLVNAMLGEERVVVDSAPGTTRDAVEARCERSGRTYRLIDTAGLRRRTRMGTPVEVYSASRTRRAIGRADVAVLVLDAAEGVADQDQRIASEILAAGCGVVVAMNKWDRIADTPRMDPGREAVARHALRFLTYAPVLATSAPRGWGIGPLFEAIDRVAAAHRSRIGTGELNRAIGDALAAHQPSAGPSGRRLRLYYATQPQSRPPTIVLFVNDPALVAQDYLRYLERAVRASFDLTGVPLRFVVRRRRDGGRDV